MDEKTELMPTIDAILIADAINELGRLIFFLFALGWSTSIFFSLWQKR